MSDSASDVQEERALNRPLAPASQADREEQQAISDLSRKQQKDQLSMRVKVYSPFRDYYDGLAFSVSAENATGPFDILPKHHNFISLLLPCNLVIRTASKADQTIRIAGGIMHVKADRVIVFLDV